jgi:hypothetical protein
VVEEETGTPDQKELEDQVEEESQDTLILQIFFLLMLLVTDRQIQVAVAAVGLLEIQQVTLATVVQA